jgi:hypothetical protein
VSSKIKLSRTMPFERGIVKIETFVPRGFRRSISRTRKILQGGHTDIRFDLSSSVQMTYLDPCPDLRMGLIR